jgi:hypothetical protein
VNRRVAGLAADRGGCDRKARRSVAADHERIDGVGASFVDYSLSAAQQATDDLPLRVTSPHHPFADSTEPWEYLIARFR